MSSGLPSVELSIMYFKPILKLQNLFSLSFALDYFLDRCQRGPVGSVLLIIIGWLVGW